MQNISKRAFDAGKINSMVKKVWKQDMGLFENFFRLAPYIGMIWFKVPIWKILAAAVGSHGLGMDISKLGKMLDDYAGTGPSEIREANTKLTIEDIRSTTESFMTQLLKKHAAQHANDMITKQAIPLIGTLLRSAKFAGTFATIVGKLVGGLLVLFGVASIDDLLREVFASAEEKTTPQIKKDETSKELAPTTPTPTPQAQESHIDSMLGKLEKKYNLIEEPI